ncbi:unnamed protein product [Medioppia subpectinata]|uniref:mRNA export factor GLE1 n=1 Tax=Medioppia subpectinata TaxID=1979941 RepID=A0A7R9KXG7_9ACAR|nr:unnamed protein product [Medioppia subpectinata]CAG2110535.1 unnamed protein product [Medioppia subpectinata]
MNDIERLKQSTANERQMSGTATEEQPLFVETTHCSVSSGIPSNQSNSMSDCVDNKAFKDYLNLQKFSNDFENSFQSFVSETKFKQKRNDLQLFVKTTINTISCESVEHIRDKLNRLTQLLSEKNVEYGAKQMKCCANDGSLNFCISLTSKMFVSVCTKQKDIALTMAPIVVLLWQRFPTFGKIFMAQMHDKCPYLVPYYPKRDTEDNADNESKYMIACGYTIAKDGTLEPEDAFLNRMRAMIKLYSAVIQSNVDDNHPHGLMFAWIWIARTLNLKPRPAITAAVLDSFLGICSHKLYRYYGKQFVKIIDFISNDYMKRIENVTTKETKRQSLVKLEMTVADMKRKLSRNANHRDMAPDGIIPDFFFEKLKAYISKESSNSSSLGSCCWAAIFFSVLFIQSCSDSTAPESRADKHAFNTSSPDLSLRNATKACSEFTLTIEFFSFVPFTRSGTNVLKRTDGNDPSLDLAINVVEMATSLVKLEMTVADMKRKLSRNANHRDMAPDGIIPDFFFEKLKAYISKESSNSSSLGSCCCAAIFFSVLFIQSCSDSTAPESRADKHAFNTSSPDLSLRNATKACSEFTLTIEFFSFVPFTRSGTNVLKRTDGNDPSLDLAINVVEMATVCFTSLLCLEMTTKANPCEGCEKYLRRNLGFDQILFDEICGPFDAIDHNLNSI